MDAYKVTLLRQTMFSQTLEGPKERSVDRIRFYEYHRI